MQRDQLSQMLKTATQSDDDCQSLLQAIAETEVQFEEPSLVNEQGFSDEDATPASSNLNLSWASRRFQMMTN